MPFMNSMLRAGMVLGLGVCASMIPATSAIAGYGSSFKVKRVIIEWDAIFIEADGIQNPDGCSYTARMKLPSDASLRDLYYSMTMTALTTGKTVQAYTNGCTSSPWGDLPNAYHLNISS